MVDKDYLYKVLNISQAERQALSVTLDRQSIVRGKELGGAALRSELHYAQQQVAETPESPLGRIRNVMV